MAYKHVSCEHRKPAASNHIVDTMTVCVLSTCWPGSLSTLSLEPFVGSQWTGQRMSILTNGQDVYIMVNTHTSRGSVSMIVASYKTHPGTSVLAIKNQILA